MRGMKEDRQSSRGSSRRAPETVVLRAVVRGLRRLRKYRNPSQVLCREAPTSTHPTWLSPAGSLRRHVWRCRLQTCHCWLEKAPSQPQERHICCSNIAFTFLPTLHFAEKARSDLEGRTEFALSFSMNQSEVARNGKTTPQKQACFWVRVCMEWFCLKDRFWFLKYWKLSFQLAPGVVWRSKRNWIYKIERDLPFAADHWLVSCNQSPLAPGVPTAPLHFISISSLSSVNGKHSHIWPGKETENRTTTCWA